MYRRLYAAIPRVYLAKWRRKARRYIKVLPGRIRPGVMRKDV